MGKKYVKPNKEEIEAEAQKLLEEAEALKKAGKENQEEGEPTPSKAEEDPTPSKAEDPSPSKAEEDPTPSKAEEPSPSKAPPPKPKSKEELKKKLKASSQEAIVLHASNKKIQEAIANADKIVPPTDEEMAKEHQDWENLDEFSKKMARDVYIANKKLLAVTEVSGELKDLDSWNTKVNEYVEDPKTLVDIPALDGREDEFKAFALKPTRRGLDFEDLTKAFLYDVDEVKKTTPKKKGGQMENQSGNSNSKPPKPTKISAEKASQIRETDYNEYVRLAKAGMIEDDL